jgi:hypothetical protein
MLHPNTPVVIFLYIYASISILFTAYAGISLLIPIPDEVTSRQTSSRNISTATPMKPFTLAKKLLIYLHFALLVQEIVLLPFAFTGNPILCRIIGFIHSYSGLSNIVATFLLTLYCVNYISWSSKRIDQLIVRSKDFLCVLFPLITAIPLVMDDYGKHDAWCQMHFQGIQNNSEAFALAIVFYYMWMWSFQFLTMVTLAVAVFDGLKTGGGWFVVKSIVTNTGAYGIITWTCSIPHTIRKVLESMLLPRGNLLLTLPLYTAGILFGLIYICNPSITELPDKAYIRETELEFKMSDLDIQASENPMRVSKS